MDDYMLTQKRFAYVQSLEINLKRIVDRLGKIPEVRQAILFGSYAEGRRDLFTDLDIIVIMDSDMDFIQRTANLYQVLNVGVDLDLLVYKPDEFEKMRTRGFVRQALKSGQVIYEKPGI